MNSYVVNLYPVPNDGYPGQTLDVNSAQTYQFTQPLDYKTTCCYITVTGGDFYVTFDGSTPSPTNGHHIVVPFTGWWSKEATRVAKMKSTGGAVAHVTFSQFTY